MRDQIENYNSEYHILAKHIAAHNLVVNRDVTMRFHPEAMRPFIPEVSSFARYNHFNILHPVLQCVLDSLLLSERVCSYMTRLVARGLELPEDTLVNAHQFDADGETYVRFMK